MSLVGTLYLKFHESPKFFKFSDCQGVFLEKLLALAYLIFLASCRRRFGLTSCPLWCQKTDSDKTFDRF